MCSVVGLQADSSDSLWYASSNWAWLCTLQGSLVRAVRRIEEVMRQLVAAANVIGEAALASKFETGIGKIKRDIIFAASLYL